MSRPPAHMSLRRAVPSLSALSTFEAAARLGSFTHAATELGVTQAAVSRQIRLLETDLNTPLFLRAHRKVILTAQGAALAQRVSAAFGSIAQMVETIRQPIQPDTVTVGATLAFSHFWILPRLAAFRAAHPAIKLRLISEDSHSDLRRDRLDVEIRFGRAPFRDARIEASHAEQVFAVGAPIFAHNHKRLEELPLISSEALDPSWLTWRAWSQALGLGPALSRAADLGTLRFNYYTDTIQAAVAAEGVALGWATLVADLIAQGRLARVGAQALRTEEGYHILTPLGRETSPAARVFIDWLRGAFALSEARALAL